MSSHSREKIALVVLTLLIALSLFGLGSYMLAGHSWNVAASNIDDAFGSMDGYTAIVYAGTEEPEVEKSTATESKAVEEPQTTDEAQTGETAKLAEVPKAEEAKAAEEPEAVEESKADEGAKTESGLSVTDAVAAGKQAVSSSIPLGSSEAKTVSVDEVQASYEEKQATVFALDTTNLAKYEEGTILKKGNHRFGVFSAVEPLSVIELDKMISYFKRCEVDFIVALTPDKAYIDQVEGIDIVVSTQDEELFVMGETIKGTFYVDASEIGKVGAILISPSNVVSAKVIEEV